MILLTFYALLSFVQSNFHEEEVRLRVHPSSLLSCNQDEYMYLETNVPLQSESYNVYRNLLVLHSTAVGMFVIKCVSSKSRKFIIDIIPYFYAHNSEIMRIRPMKNIYDVGEIIYCKSSIGYKFSRWEFLWSSARYHVPYFYTYENELKIDVNFRASVTYIFICDGQHIRFQVRREAYNVAVKVQQIMGKTILTCHAEGTNLTFIWKTFSHRVEHAIVPQSKGSSLIVDMEASISYHQVACIAVSSTDSVDYAIRTFYNEPIEKGTPFIYAPKKFYFRHEIIRCFSSAYDAVLKWICKRSADIEIFESEKSTLALSDEYFSIMNAKYSCHCNETNNIQYSKNIYSRTDRNEIIFYMRRRRIKQCMNGSYENFLKALRICCLLVIVLSLFGPLRYINLRN